jgi:hypothetical protein
MTNQDIWDKFLKNNESWQSSFETGDKICLSYFQLKKIIEVAAKYAREPGLPTRSQNHNPMSAFGGIFGSAFKK